MILYRGTPEPEDFPVIREHEGIFMSSDPYAAANYGDYVQSYEVGKPRLLDFRTKRGIQLVSRFLGMKPDVLGYSLEAQKLAYYPPPPWVESLHDDLDYDGYILNPEIISLFEPYVLRLPIKLVGRQVLEVR